MPQALLSVQLQRLLMRRRERPEQQQVQLPEALHRLRRLLVQLLRPLLLLLVQSFVDMRVVLRVPA
jgi:hypothetical protein